MPGSSGATAHGTLRNLPRRTFSQSIISKYNRQVYLVIPPSAWERIAPFSFLFGPTYKQHHHRQVSHNMSHHHINRWRPSSNIRPHHSIMLARRSSNTSP